MTKRRKILLSAVLFFSIAIGIGGYFSYLNFFNSSSKNIFTGLDLVLVDKKTKIKDPKLEEIKDYKESDFIKFNSWAVHANDKNDDLNIELGQKESFFSELSSFDLKKIKQNNIIFPEGYKGFDFNTDNNFVTKENNEKFLGSENDNLLVYDLNYPKINELIQEKEAFKSDILNQKFTIFDSKARNKIFKINKIGVYSQPLKSEEYDWIYQKNVKFKTGTAAILDASHDKALLITNYHVIKPSEYSYKDETFEINSQNLRFWNKLGGNFLEWYDNGKIYSLDRDNTALLFYLKEVFEKKIVQPDHAKVIKYLIDFYNNYFEIPSNFDDKKFDIGIFYFNYKKFNEDLKSLAKFYYDKKAEILKKIQQNNKVDNLSDKNKGSIESKFNDFLISYQNFINFWEKMSKEKPVEISEKVWKKGDYSYDLNISLFWPKAKIMKNNFKGVFANDPQENFSRLSLYFYTNNGPGASGSGVFNKKGELQFINAFGLINNFYNNDSKVEKNYYDKLNTNISLSGGVPLVTEEYNLASSIKSFYPSKQKNAFSFIKNEDVKVIDVLKQKTRKILL
ncbi:Mhp366/Mhp367 family surface (lipo)protein [Mesomycoplasma flocculare]|uniref:DUF31 domain-containing protein n=1 Tax=Mesomycoplasma flocculare TaxID=2128 RepID=A0AAW9XC21_MESFC|nr:hypothetical protein [Mesomycoplasma flocculare]MXR05971.1 hypothetical protein [Mesomycoplasma flocculare]MXR22961.1 hypothetical protein [Mesomycoplasma flocculare]MXR39517.1 hypothetical protein [Mycoplasma sp. MF12]MXR56794.1 hypothetical protein [Mesomycoplasma flocculare]